MEQKACSPPLVFHCALRQWSLIIKMGGVAANHPAMEKLTPMFKRSSCTGRKPHWNKALPVLPGWDVFRLQMQTHLLRKDVNQRVLLSSPESSSAPTQTRSDYGNYFNLGHTNSFISSLVLKQLKTSTPQVQSADFKKSRAVHTAALLLQWKIYDRREQKITKFITYHQKSIT